MENSTREYEGDLGSALWRKSTHSGGSGSDCLEVLDGHPDVTPVRDSKNPRGPRIPFRTAAWSAFVAHLKES
ncbi:DUF397 domain-containing protein [Streptomyces sp. NPDC002564]|uniref:DUF397 domain-containing protein n=1 Tax=Streptomyces sp. NPDC002564 TaxID=3364649 RepID=UPI00368E979B